MREKRTFSVLLAAVLVVSMMPAALAADVGYVEVVPPKYDEIVVFSRWLCSDSG